MTRCFRVTDGHGVHFSWRVNTVPDNQNYAWISASECVSIGQTAIATCSKHGGDGIEVSASAASDGGQAVELTVRADPQWKHCDC